MLSGIGPTGYPVGTDSHVRELGLCHTVSAASRRRFTIDDVAADGARHGLTPEQVAENIVTAVARSKDPTQA